MKREINPYYAKVVQEAWRRQADGKYDTFFLVVRIITLLLTLTALTISGITLIKILTHGH